MKNNYSASDKAYTAAIIDGEGWIYANKFRRKDTGHMSTPCQIGVANTCKRVLEWLQTRYGGKIYHRNGSNMYSWEVIRMSEMLNLLKSVRPYMIIKRDIADLMIAFLELRVDSIVDGHYSNMMSEKANKLVYKIKDLNKTKSYL